MPLRGLAIIGLLGILVAVPLRASPMPPGPLPSAGLASLVRAAAAPGLRPVVQRRALEARERAMAGGVGARPLLTVIDYSLPSRQRRLWVLDLARGRVLAHELVARAGARGVGVRLP